MGRRRSTKTKGLPPNLYERSGYFSWRDPRDGKEYGVGRDRRSAIGQAIEANHEVEGTRGRRSLVDRLVVGKDNSMGAWCDVYLTILESRKLAANSMSVFCSRLRVIREAWADRRIDAITTRDVAEFLDQWEANGRKSMAAAMRSMLLDAFKAAQAKGWVKENPVTPTKAPTVEVQRSRLTLDGFRAIHAVALEHHPAWLARAMELALVTGQRREDIAGLGPRDVRDGKLWVIQGKTKAKVCIPLALRLEVVGWSVGEVIDRCADGVTSDAFIHQMAARGSAKPGGRIRPNAITIAFAAARDRAGIAGEAGKTPPTFHELRSLAARLYAQQGTDAQSLLGHKSPEMTAAYRDGRGAEWVEVAI
ncbi:tyrosine-type recombinase/integrase [Azospirillum palustre]